MKSSRDILGVSPTASKQDIRVAYRRLARQYHPDLNSAPDAEDKFKDIQEAYDELNADKVTFAQSDVTLGALIPLEDAIFGFTRHIEFPQYHMCQKCSGRGSLLGNCWQCQGKGYIQVQFVAWSASYNQMQNAQCGVCGGRGGLDVCDGCKGQGATVAPESKVIHFPPMSYSARGLCATIKGLINPRTHLERQGDLNILVQTYDHPFYKVHGKNLACTVDVPFSTLVHGGSTKIDYFGRKQIELTIPPKMTPGSSVVLQRLGFSGGDLTVQLNVHMPETDDDIENLIKGLQNGRSKSS